MARAAQILSEDVCPVSVTSSPPGGSQAVELGEVRPEPPGRALERDRDMSDDVRWLRRDQACIVPDRYLIVGMTSRRTASWEAIAPTDQGPVGGAFRARLLAIPPGQMAPCSRLARSAERA